MVGEATMLKLRMYTNFTTQSSIIITNQSSVSIYTLHWQTQKYRSHRLMEGLLEMYHTSLRSPSQSSDIRVDFCNKFRLYSFPPCMYFCLRAGIRHYTNAHVISAGEIKFSFAQCSRTKGVDLK